MLASFCRSVLKLLGWRCELQLPAESRYVLIGYPHTSNFDFILAMLAKGAVGLRFNFVAKHTLFWWPLGSIMRALGGIPVDRTVSTGFIGYLVQRYLDAEQAGEPCVIGMMPEGTRSQRPFWKSGFYHLALQAQAPVVPGYIDFDSKTIGFGEPIYLSGDQEADLNQLREFYSPVRGRYHELAAPIQFKRAD